MSSLVIRFVKMQLGGDWVVRVVKLMSTIGKVE